MFHGRSFRKQRQDAIDVSQYPRWYVYPWSLTAYGAAPWLGKNTPFLTSSCWLTCPLHVTCARMPTKASSIHACNECPEVSPLQHNHAQCSQPLPSTAALLPWSPSHCSTRQRPVAPYFVALVFNSSTSDLQPIATASNHSPWVRIYERYSGPGF